MPRPQNSRDGRGPALSMINAQYNTYLIRNLFSLTIDSFFTESVYQRQKLHKTKLPEIQVCCIR